MLLNVGETVEFTASGIWSRWHGASWDKNWVFRIVKPEPKLIPHWPPIASFDGRYRVTDEVYQNEKGARNGQKVGDVVRLATEYPPINDKLSKASKNMENMK